MKGEVVADRDVASRPAGEDAQIDSAAGPELHDPVASLIRRLRSAAETGEGMALGQRATVQIKKAHRAFRVERGRR